jgi:putative chitinase
MISIDRALLDRIAPKFSGAKAARQNEILDEISGPITQVFNEYEINSALRIAHCLAQLGHESAGFRTTEEFASGAAYEGRKDLGNTQPGDGKRYKGRGLIQLTGRANYREFGKRMGVDLENNPETAAEPLLSLKIACEYWKERKINGPADRDDLITVTKKINGGTNGLDDRRNYLRKAKDELADRGAIIIASANPTGQPVLRRGSKGMAVADLQSKLVDAGFDLTIDGDFGPATEAIVKVFQARKKLTRDGIVGPDTWSKFA